MGWSSYSVAELFLNFISQTVFGLKSTELGTWSE